MTGHPELLRPFALANGRTESQIDLEGSTLLRTSIEGLLSLGTVAPFAQRVLVSSVHERQVDDIVNEVSVVRPAAVVVLSDLVYAGYLERVDVAERDEGVVCLVNKLREAPASTLEN